MTRQKAKKPVSERRKNKERTKNKRNKIQELKNLKPDSHERHRHKDKINSKTKHDICSGTYKDKTTRIFLCFVFCSALGLCLDYDLMLMITTILMSQA